MMVGNDQDLGLSLSLCYPAENRVVSNASSLHLDIMSSSHSLFTIINNNSWLPAFTSSDRRNETCTGETRSLFKGIDVNCLPETADLRAEEEEGGVSSPNNTISSVSGKRTERETTAGSEDHDGERASDEEDARKKLRLSKDQSTVLEESFKEHNTLNPKQKMALAKRLGLRPRQVEVWFQNRRARTKLKQTEVDCEFLKRCCENLTEENRRLQKEVQELRALKLSPQLYTQMTPPTTLTMCPSCERMALTVDDSSSSSHLQQPMGSTKQRPIPFNPWAAAATLRCRPLYALHSTS